MKTRRLLLAISITAMGGVNFSVIKFIVCAKRGLSRDGFSQPLCAPPA